MNEKWRQRPATAAAASVLLLLPVLVQTKNVLLHNKPPVMPSTESVADVAVRLRISHFDDGDDGDEDEGDHFEMSTAEAEGEEISQLYSATSGQVYRCVGLLKKKKQCNAKREIWFYLW